MPLSKSTRNSKFGRKFAWFSDEQQVSDRRSIAVLSTTAQSPSAAGSVVYASADPSVAGRDAAAAALAGNDGALSAAAGSTPVDPPKLAYPPSTLSRRVTSVETPPTDTSVVANHHSASMSGAQAKTSSDSGQQAALDRWSQRRLQRLNTEQGFREQRQGGQAVFTPPLTASDASSFTSSSGGGLYIAADAQPPSSSHYPSQPNPSQQAAANPGARTAPLLATYTPTTGNSATTSTTTTTTPPQVAPSSNGHIGAVRTAGYQSHDSFHANATSQQPQPPLLPQQIQQQQSQPQQQQQQQPPPQYSPNPNSPHPSHHLADSSRSLLNQTRSFSQQSGPDDTASMSNNGTTPNPKVLRSANANRQSIHNGMSRESSSISAQGGQPGVPPIVNPAVAQQQSKAEVGRGTPQSVPVNAEEMTDEDVAQLVREHKELRDKYTKVKKYYFEKEDQVKQLQNSLAHQRLSQSRTSLDDSEYTTRFNRLDGLIAQLAFSIRKSWRSIPAWLQSSVNKDAVVTGKQEMTAVGRAVISSWLVDEMFDKFFHPDLDPQLSTQLKSIQKSIRKFAPLPQSAEEEESLTTKVVNWRLATLDGLQEVLRSPQCRNYRQQLIEMLNDHLVGVLSVHLQDPPPSDLPGGVRMIVELVVSIAIHLPLESRDVHIEYFPPNYSIMQEQMKLESGIPPLSVSVADDAAERASLKSANSDVTDATETSVPEQTGKKRSMLSAFTGGGGKSKSSSQGKHAAAGNSSGSLQRPESAQGHKEEGPPRVRMAAGIGVSIRGRSVLVKAPVFST